MRGIRFPVHEKGVETDIIYVCGDSHSMSSAWQMLNIKGNDKPCLIFPKLVTGLKCWYLRDEGRFYPKRNFEFAVNSMPDGASAVFLFGEIDCRDGILLAVEKCKYKNIDEGISIIIDHYLKKLSEAALRKKLRVYVHPVAPVLNPTRTMVKKFNTMLRDRVNEHATLHFLDFFGDLLDSNGSFNLKYALDGTHMSAAYCPLLEKALEGPHKIDRV